MADLEIIILEKELIKEIEELKIRLQEVKREKSALFKIVSHDLRSPMNKLFALIGLFKMSDDALSNEQVNYLEKMELVISDGLNKIHNLMDLRAIEDKGITTLWEDINIGSLINRVIKGFNPTAERKGLTVTYQEVPAAVYSDKLSCQRILEQLISNALKYSPENSTIKVKLYELPDTIEIRIIDGGYGISEAEQVKLFQKFTILSSRATGGESSTGIGLYIAQWMANNIGGKINYENDGKSEFIFRLPVKKA